jgi:hypothetical protein
MPPVHGCIANGGVHSRVQQEGHLVGELKLSHCMQVEGTQWQSSDSPAGCWNRANRVRPRAAQLVSSEEHRVGSVVRLPGSQATEAISSTAVAVSSGEAAGGGRDRGTSRMATLCVETSAVTCSIRMPQVV